MIYTIVADTRLTSYHGCQIQRLDEELSYIHKPPPCSSAIMSQFSMGVEGDCINATSTPHLASGDVAEDPGGEIVPQGKVETTNGTCSTRTVMLYPPYSMELQ
jgi:hypothetical protein